MTKVKFHPDPSSLEKKPLGATYIVDKNIIVKNETSQYPHKYS